jgi:hypothetical protein
MGALSPFDSNLADTGQLGLDPHVLRTRLSYLSVIEHLGKLRQSLLSSTPYLILIQARV